jgi:hypothetical protein
MKIKDLLEAEEKSLVGMEIDGTTLPVEGKWEGDFDCSYNELTSLEGAPSSVGGDFWCSNNQLTSLEGAPSTVGVGGGDFYCSDNRLTSLEGAPSSVGGDFFCSHNQLTSLEGAPSSVDGDFRCSHNQLTSLKDIHKQIKKINGSFYCRRNPIKSHVLGLLLIDGLKSIDGDDQVWVPILNQAIKQFDDKRKRVMWAQSELIKQLGEEGKALAKL